MICSRMLAGVDQSILRSTRNPLLNHDDSKCTTSRSSAARSVWPFMRRNRSAPNPTNSLGEPFPVRTVVAHQGFKERKAAGVVEVPVAVEHLARHRGAGGFAPARQQRLA